MRNEKPCLYIVIPCYNEEKVLPLTSKTFRDKIEELVGLNMISGDSRVLFVNDGSKDRTWEIIQLLSENETYFEGISLSRNRGHQNALLAGLMEAKDKCDITISIDCDGQDDINAMNDMVNEYLNGSEIVYGVRKNRDTDTFLKKTTAEGFYKVLKLMGADVVFNHADYRLTSAKVLNEFAGFKEVNLFLRGMFPLVGFKSTCVYYDRHERLAGESHYPLKKMLALAFDGITSLSVRPIGFITGCGVFLCAANVLALIVMLIIKAAGGSVSGTAFATVLICFVGGLNLTATGVIGTYIGKIYMETKGRPRYIIEERTSQDEREQYTEK